MSDVRMMRANAFAPRLSGAALTDRAADSQDEPAAAPQALCIAAGSGGILRRNDPSASSDGRADRSRQVDSSPIALLLGELGLHECAADFERERVDLDGLAE